MKRRNHLSLMTLLGLILTACAAATPPAPPTPLPPTSAPTLNVPTYDPGQQPTQPPAPTEVSAGNPLPPSVWLVDASGTRQEGALGSYCWSTDTAGICADAIWPPTQLPIYIIAAGSAIHIEFEEPLPARFTVSLWDRSGQATVATSGERAPEGSSYDWPSRAVPGDYLLSVQSFWDAGGDSFVSFGITIQ